MVDTAQIQIKAGNGGNGVATFLRAKYLPKGGPDGGDGGNGGSIYLVGDHNLATLMDYRSKKNYKAEKGSDGMRRQQKGKDGEDLYIKLPLGTLVYEIEDDKEVLVADIEAHNQKILIAQGGKGGKGNHNFKSSTNQAPKQFTKGSLGEEKSLRLEIKVIADVGLVGAPNAGKSTLINYLTNSQAKVASYPFTTISPNLGILRLKSDQKVVIADIPGLIKGASEGKGLGDDFLRHIERTRVLVHLIDPFNEDVTKIVEQALNNYEMIQNELKNYKVDLSEKPQIVVINKVDLIEVSENLESIKKELKAKYNLEVFGISAVTGAGVDSLIEELTVILNKAPKIVFIQPVKKVKKYTISTLPNKRVVYGLNEVFEVK